MIQSVPIGFLDDTKALAQAVDMLYSDALTAKSLILSLLLFSQFPVSRFFMRNVAASMNFGDANVAQIAFYFDFSVDFQPGFLKYFDVRFATL